MKEWESLLRLCRVCSLDYPQYPLELKALLEWVPETILCVEVPHSVEVDLDGLWLQIESEVRCEKHKCLLRGWDGTAIGM